MWTCATARENLVHTILNSPFDSSTSLWKNLSCSRFWSLSSSFRTCIWFFLLYCNGLPFTIRLLQIISQRNSASQNRQLFTHSWFDCTCYPLQHLYFLASFGAFRYRNLSSNLYWSQYASLDNLHLEAHTLCRVADSRKTSRITKGERRETLLVYQWTFNRDGLCWLVGIWMYRDTFQLSQCERCRCDGYHLQLPFPSILGTSRFPDRRSSRCWQYYWRRERVAR